MRDVANETPEKGLQLRNIRRKIISEGDRGASREMGRKSEDNKLK